MSWGRIDDKLHAHPKPESAGLEAMGLWVLALSYSSDVLTDGFISTERAARLAGDLKSSKRLALKLIGVGLWHLANDPCPSGHDDCDRYRRDEAGFRFHDWDLYQPTRGEVLAEKDRKKKNLEAYRERRRLPRNRNETGCTTGITTGSATDSEAGCDATKKPGGNHGPLPLPSPEEISTGIPTPQSPPETARADVGPAAAATEPLADGSPMANAISTEMAKYKTTDFIARKDHAIEALVLFAKNAGVHVDEIPEAMAWAHEQLITDAAASGGLVNEKITISTIRSAFKGAVSKRGRPRRGGGGNPVQRSIGYQATEDAKRAEAVRQADANRTSDEDAF